MLPILKNIVSRRPTEEISPPCDPEVEAVGRALKRAVDARMRRSLAIRELDSGSDNATEIEINLLSSPHYDVERFGVSFVASPRHADLLLVTGAVTRNMEVAVKKTYEAMPAPPKYVVAVGDAPATAGSTGEPTRSSAGRCRPPPRRPEDPGQPARTDRYPAGDSRSDDQLKDAGLTRPPPLALHPLRLHLLRPADEVLEFHEFPPGAPAAPPLLHAASCSLQHSCSMRLRSSIEWRWYRARISPPCSRTNAAISARRPFGPPLAPATPPPYTGLPPRTWCAP